MAEQVLTTGQVAEAGKGFSGQEVAPVSATAGKGAGLIDVKHGSASATPARRRKGRRKGRAKRRKGGWKATKCIGHALRKDTKRKARLLLYEGYEFTDFATARGVPGQSDAKSKRHVGLMFARLGQNLERAGYLCVGLVTFEKHNGFMHGHLSLHAPGDGRAVVRAWADRYDDEPTQPHELVEGVEKHARPFVTSDIDYQTKQHHFCGKYEPLVSKFWQEGERFTGTRVAWTKGAKAIIKRAEERHHKVAAAHPKPIEAAPRAAPELRIVVNALVADPVQLSLFPEKDRPVSRLANFGGHVLPAAVAIEIEARRRWRGMTQAQLAEQIGISRPQLVNVLKGRFPVSVWAAARLREFLLGDERAAAA